MGYGGSNPSLRTLKNPARDFFVCVGRSARRFCEGFEAQLSRAWTVFRNKRANRDTETVSFKSLPTHNLVCEIFSKYLYFLFYSCVLSVIPRVKPRGQALADAEIQIKSQRLWIPFFKGMTERGVNRYNFCSCIFPDTKL